jgi:arylsulfatase
MKGWDVLRQEKLQKMEEMGIVSKNQKLSEERGYIRKKLGKIKMGYSVESAVLPKWDSLREEEKKELDFRRTIYAAQVERLDWNIGRIISRLKELNLLDNTLTLFFSDNGCSGEDSTFNMNWGKYTVENYPEWRKKSGWSISQGQCWASAFNAPLRKYKHFVHEGAIASPFIAHWPKWIWQQGELNTNQIFHVIDIMPTLWELSGAEYPRIYKGSEILPYQGNEHGPYFRNVGAKSVARTLFWQHKTCSAVRRGNWKLVTAFDRDQNSWELYDLSEDRSETENQVSEKQKLASELKELWFKWAKEVNVLPFPENRK